MVIDLSTWIDSGNRIDRTTLVSRLLEKGFPIKFSQGDFEQTSDSQSLYLRFGEQETTSTGASPGQISISVAEQDLDKIVNLVEEQFTMTLEGVTPRK